MSKNRDGDGFIPETFDLGRGTGVTQFIVLSTCPSPACTLALFWGPAITSRGRTTVSRYEKTVCCKSSDSFDRKDYALVCAKHTSYILNRPEAWPKSNMLVPRAHLSYVK